MIYDISSSGHSAFEQPDSHFRPMNKLDQVDEEPKRKPQKQQQPTDDRKDNAISFHIPRCVGRRGLTQIANALDDDVDRDADDQ